MVGDNTMSANFIPLFALATSISRIKGQSICETDDQCDLGYYCNQQLYSCDKCVTCDNFEQGDSCAKTIEACGSLSHCLDGYKYTEDGRCIPASITPKLIITIGSITVVVAMLVAGAVHMYRRKKFVFDINPERGRNTSELPLVRATAPAIEPDYQDRFMPPSYNHHYKKETYTPMIVDETKLMAPLLNSDVFAYAGQPLRERMQGATLANPPRYDALWTVDPPNVNLPVEEVQEDPPPTPEAIPLHNMDIETQEPEDEENEQVVGETPVTAQQTRTTAQQTRTTPQQTQAPEQQSVHIILNLNNTNCVNLLASQNQNQYNRNGPTLDMGDEPTNRCSNSPIQYG